MNTSMTSETTHRDGTCHCSALPEAHDFGETGATQGHCSHGETEQCACGCGEPATETVRLLREQDEATAEALGWAEMSVAPMRVPVRVAAGHEGDVDGYVVEDDE